MKEHKPKFVSRLPEAGEDVMLPNQVELRGPIDRFKMEVGTVYTLPPSQLSQFIDVVVGGKEDKGLEAIDSLTTSTQLLREQVDDVLSRLTDQERRVIRLRFGLEDGRSRSFREVGTDLGISKSTAHTRVKSALRKLRTPSRTRRIKDYLEG